MRNILVMLVLVMTAGCQLAASVTGETQQRSLPGFERIEVGGLVNVIVVQGDTPKAVVNASGIDIEDVVTRVEDGTLTIDSKGFHRGESIWVTVTYRQLQSVKTSGAATIESDGAIKGENFAITISGSGDASLELNVASLSATMSGAGNLTLTGKAKHQHIVSSGSRGSLNNAGLAGID